jgi:regulator of cell morphogenesis and NO signaling
MSLDQKDELATWQSAPLTDLIRHLVSSRHQESREDMAGLETLLALLAMEPGPGHLALGQIRDLVARFCTEFRAHLAREEQDLFPVLLAMEQGQAPDPGNADLGLMGALLEEDHCKEAMLLQDIQVLAEALAGDPHADSAQARIHASVTALFERFVAHVRLENQILFPRMR